MGALTAAQPSFAYAVPKTTPAVSSNKGAAVHIEVIQVLPDTNTQSLTIHVHLVNADTKERHVMLTGSLLAATAGAKWTYPTITDVSALLRPGGNQMLTLGPLRWTPGKASWWWPNVPYQPNYHAQLHRLTLMLRDAKSGAKISQSGKIQTRSEQTQTVRFGFCTPGQTGSKYTLNGIRINLRGDSLSETLYGEADGKSSDKPSEKPVGNVSGTKKSVQQPGFLPPINANPGWPGAVRNYQRLNFNVVCLKQPLCTPYRLDICDELGLLIIPEASQSEVSIQPLRELVLQDRNHPCIFKWSLASELSNVPATSGSKPSFLNESQLRKLHDVCMEADGSRPCSIDANMTPPTLPRFAVIENNTQPSGTPLAAGGHARQDHPYGQILTVASGGTTSISSQNVVWSALQTRSLRAHDNADSRLSTLLALWPEVIPGFGRTQKSALDPKISPGTAKTNGRAIIDPRAPWQDPALHLLQRSFAPVCAFDQNWDGANTPSNGSGFYPSVFPVLAPGYSTIRTLTVFNDEFAGTALEVTIRLLLHPTLKQTLPLASFVHTLTVPLGGHIGCPVTVKAPASADNTALEMQIIVRKGGKERFRERTFFLVQGTHGTRLRFTGRDDKTQGNWQGSYGQQAFLLPMRGGVAQSTEAGISIQRGTGFDTVSADELHSDRNEDPNAMYEWDRTPILNDARLPPTGKGLTERHAIAFQGSQGMAIRVDGKDGKAHRLSLYLLDFARTGLALDIDAFDLQGHPLDTRRIDNYGGGSYIHYNFTGSVVLILRSLIPEQNPLLTGIFIDAPQETRAR